MTWKPTDDTKRHTAAENLKEWWYERSHKELPMNSLDVLLENMSLEGIMHLEKQLVNHAGSLPLSSDDDYHPDCFD